MRFFLPLLMSGLIQPVFAQIPFKQDNNLSMHGFPYGLALIGLIIVVAITAKQLKWSRPAKNQVKILERLFLHSKTKAYVLEYQGQRFLIADNQQALAIQALKEETHR